MKRPLVRYLLGLLIGTVAGTADAQGIGSSMAYIPADANTICVLDMAGLVSSPRGTAEKWGEKHEQAHLDGAVTIPPWVRVLVRSSHFIPGERGESWTTAFTPVSDDFDIAVLATKEGTEVQDVRGRPVVQSTRYNGYFALLPATANRSTEKLLGLMFPASRQQISAWLSRALGAPQVSKYLQDAVNVPGAQVVLAFDMEDMLDPAQIRYRLDGAASVKDNSRAKAALTIDMQSLQGVRLAISVTDKINATVKLDFKRSIGSESEFIKPLFLELLSDAGADLPEFADSSVSVAANSVTLRTTFSDESLRKVLSLITTPHVAAQEATPQTPAPPTPGTPPTPEAVSMEASQKYYRAVISNLRDLERAFRAKSPSYGRSATWHETYANRIDHLPTEGVHPELTVFAADMSRGLRTLSDLLRGLDVDIRRLDQKITYREELKYSPRSGVDWWWGPPVTTTGYVMTPRNTEVVVHTNVDQVRAAQADAADANTQKRDQVWQSMASERDEVERKMVETFGRTFLNP